MLFTHYLQPDVPASADKAADGDSEEDGEEELNEHARPGGPRWTKFEDGAAIMQVDVESRTRSMPIHVSRSLYTRFILIYTLFTRYLHI